MRADAVQQLRDVHGPDRVLELLPGLFRLPIPLPRNPLRGAQCLSDPGAGEKPAH